MSGEKTEVDDRDLATKIVHAASDYKLGCENSAFAEEYGGVDSLRQELFGLLDEWSGE
jgi:hypothetical protein